MTENNTGDRRFWMVVAEYIAEPLIAAVVTKSDGDFKFSDDKEASSVAEMHANDPNCTGVYVVEAVSRFVLPEPKVVKQNLHIPPLPSREV